MRKRANEIAAEQFGGIEPSLPRGRVPQQPDGTVPIRAAAPAVANASSPRGTNKERILAAIKAGHKETRQIREATGIKPAVLYADLGKLRADGVITRTNRLKTTRPKPKTSKRR